MSSPPKTPKGQDRRRCPRWLIAKPIKIHCLDTNRYYSAQSLDASWSGIGFRLESPGQLRAGQQIEVSLPSDGSQGVMRRDQLVPAVVTRVSQNSHYGVCLGDPEEAKQAA